MWIVNKAWPAKYSQSKWHGLCSLKSEAFLRKFSSVIPKDCEICPTHMTCNPLDSPRTVLNPLWCPGKAKDLAGCVTLLGSTAVKPRSLGSLWPQSHCARPLRRSRALLSDTRQVPGMKKERAGPSVQMFTDTHTTEQAYIYHQRRELESMGCPHWWRGNSIFWLALLPHTHISHLFLCHSAVSKTSEHLPGRGHYYLLTFSLSKATNTVVFPNDDSASKERVVPMKGNRRRHPIPIAKSHSGEVSDSRMNKEWKVSQITGYSPPTVYLVYFFSNWEIRV